MAVQKLSSTDGFVVVDFPDAPASGVVRRARKILQSGAKDLARSATYTFASFGLERSGASAGINAEGEGVDAAIEAFVTEVAAGPDSGRPPVHLEAGKGVTPGAIAPLREVAGAGPLAGSPDLLAASVLAATSWALGGSVEGRTVAVEAADQAPPEVPAALVNAGATIVEVDGVDEKPWLIWGASADAILAGSKAGTLTHQGTPFVTASAIVPWGPIPATTKAFAELRKGGAVTLVPDFVSIAGHLVGGFIDGDEAAVTRTVVDRVVAILEEAATHPDGTLLGACYLAESFIEGWQGAKPFGRPLAA